MFADLQTQYQRLAARFQQAGLDIFTFPWKNVLLAGGYVAGIRLQEFDPEMHRESDLDLFIYGTKNREHEMDVVIGLLRHLGVDHVALTSKGNVCNVVLNEVPIQIILHDAWAVWESEVPKYYFPPSKAKTVLDDFDMSHVRYGFDGSRFVDRTGQYVFCGISSLDGSKLVRPYRYWKAVRRGFQVQYDPEEEIHKYVTEEEYSKLKGNKSDELPLCPIIEIIDEAEFKVHIPCQKIILKLDGVLHENMYMGLSATTSHWWHMLIKKMLGDERDPDYHVYCKTRIKSRLSRRYGSRYLEICKKEAVQGAHLGNSIKSQIKYWHNSTNGWGESDVLLWNPVAYYHIKEDADLASVWDDALFGDAQNWLHQIAAYCILYNNLPMEILAEKMIHYLHRELWFPILGDAYLLLGQEHPELFDGSCGILVVNLGENETSQIWGNEKDKSGWALISQHYECEYPTGNLLIDRNPDVDRHVPRCTFYRVWDDNSVVRQWHIGVFVNDGEAKNLAEEYLDDHSDELCEIWCSQITPASNLNKKSARK